MKSETTLDLGEATDAILAVWLAGEMPCLIGPPGIGKTDIAAMAAERYAQAIGKTVQFFNRSMSAMTGEDFAMPDRDPSGAIIQKPINALRVLCEGPGVLLLDEQNRCGHSTQNTLLTLVQSRVIGDGRLDPHSRLLGAMNDEDSEGGDGARTRISALADRQIDLNVRASFSGVFDYLNNRVGAPGSAERELAVDYAYTADRSRALVSLEPSPGEVKRPSPRAIVKGITSFASALKLKLSDKVSRATLSGAIGEDAAGAYLAIRKIREHLPTPDEIEKNPLGAKLPQNVDVALGVMGLLGVAGSRNPNSAWLYLGRWGGPGPLQEVGTAAGKTLLRGANAPTTPDACKVRDRMLGTVGLANAGRTVGLSW